MNKELERVFSCLDKDYLVDLACSITDIQSPTGYEADMAKYFHGVLKELGMRSHLQEISPGRYNSVGLLEGKGTGPRLMFNGHMDTSFSGTEDFLDGGGDGYSPKSQVIDGEWIYGMGVYNMKSALAAYCSAVHTIQKAGVKLNGDIVIAAVSGEIEKVPYGRDSGDLYQGYGVGTKYLVAHGVTADMAIIGEPTRMRVSIGHPGSLWVRIGCSGTLAHTAFVERAVNAIERMLPVINAVREWIPKYREENRMPEFDGLMPNVNMSCIEGGYPWRLSRTPAYCNLYLDVRIPPKLTAMKVLRMIQEVVWSAAPEGERFEVDLFSSNPATYVSKDTQVVQEIEKAHELVVGKKPEHVVLNWYSDATFLNAADIPTVIYGPAGRIRTGGSGWSIKEGEHQSISDLIQCTQVYISTLLSICGRD
ncbi:MAG: M20 family metallopeptidase [Desulfitobacteriia bacterium]|jgi:acetylornithine deacetylase